MTIYHNADISAFLCLCKNLCMLPFSSSYYRCQKLNLRPFRQCHKFIYHLIHRLFFDFFPTLWTMRNPNSCIKQTEIIINLRYCSYRRTRITVCRFLVNGNRRRKSLYTFHIWFFHLSQKHSCIGRKRLHITSLPFRINCIKSKG